MHLFLCCWMRSTLAGMYAKKKSVRHNFQKAKSAQTVDDTTPLTKPTRPTKVVTRSTSRPKRRPAPKLAAQAVAPGAREGRMKRRLE